MLILCSTDSRYGRWTRCGVGIREPKRGWDGSRRSRFCGGHGSGFKYREACGP